MSTITVIIAFALVASACGDDSNETDVGSDPEGTVPEDTLPDTAAPSTTTPDGDEPLGAGPYPIADLAITAFGDGSDVSTAITYRLACLGDTATLTGDAPPSTAEGMCLALNDDDIRTRLIEGFPDEMVCTMQYGGPELAVIMGTLDGQAIDTAVDRTNGCGIAEWSGLLGELLPPAAT